MKIESIPISDAQMLMHNKRNKYDEVYKAIQIANKAIKVTCKTNRQAHSLSFCIKNKMANSLDFRKCKVSYYKEDVYIIPLDLVEQ